MADTYPLICVVIVNFNGGELLSEAIQSVTESTYQELKIIIVDNASHDGSIEAAAAKYKDLIFIKNEKNLGFAKGNNLGVKHALSLRCKFILFLNNDASVRSDAIELLYQHLAKHEKCGAVAPFIFYHHNQNLIWYGGGKVALWRGWIGHKHIRKQYVSSSFSKEQTDYLTGCVFLVRSELISAVIGFDSYFGLYSEDVDLSMRILNQGSELWVLPDAHAYHHVSVSSGGELSPFKAFYRGRSNALIIKRYTRPWEWLTLIVGGIIGGIALSLKLLIRGKSATVSAIWQGIFSGLLGLSIPNKYRLKNSQ